MEATAVDAAGNVFLAGRFKNTVTLGGTTLTSLGRNDVFVAKFNPISNQFVWAQRAGGTSDDFAAALAVSGTNVYVAGDFRGVANFGTTTLTGTIDIFVAKLIDAGNTGSFVWAQRAGGIYSDYAAALAVSGTSVYVAGSFEDTANFGTTTLTSTIGGRGDVFVAKLTDAGSTGSFVWAQRAGGVSEDGAYALAASGSSVYVAGYFVSPTVTFGATTLTNLVNVGITADMFVAKLTDAGSTGSFVWAQRAGGTGQDYPIALALSGTSVYVAGSFNGSTASFGPTTLTNTTPSHYNVFVTKLTDAGSTGSFVWTQQGSGPHDNTAYTVAVSGSNVYVAGYFFGSTASFGPLTLTNVGAITGPSNAFVVKLTDAGSTGSFAWAQQAGGTGYDYAYALAVSGTSVYVAGGFESATASFGSTSLTNAYAGQGFTLGFLATLTDATPTATTAALPRDQAALFPNPARRTATLRLPAGASPAPLVLTDALGRAVRHYPAPASSEATLDLRDLPAGLYLLRGAGPAQRLVVE